jgi:hypothetical protein
MNQFFPASAQRILAARDSLFFVNCAHSCSADYAVFNCLAFHKNAFFPRQFHLPFYVSKAPNPAPSFFVFVNNG